MKIRGVLFDFDGTLTRPGALDFAAIRRAVRCPEGQTILEYIASLPSETAREEARKILDDQEMAAARGSRPNAGAEELVAHLRDRKLKLGIASRNSLRAIMLALENFTRIRAADFDVILSRDDPLMPKPSPEAILAAAASMNIPPEQLLMVGDYVFDIEAGRNAGARTAFITNGQPPAAGTGSPDYIIERLGELEEIVDLGTPLPLGKLPNSLLGRFLKDLLPSTASLLIPPGVGEDIAAVELKAEEVLVLKSDPITFATDSIGYYGVVVNVNDIATCGAEPRWLLASLLFPPETCAGQIRRIMRELAGAAGRYGLILAGGHTEITDAVTRPVVVGQVAGTVSRDRLIDKRNMRPGNRILLTKGIALEGTCIIARELARKLTELGVTPEEINKCRQFLTDPGISILPEARIASACGGVTAMHDVTEGGLATAIEELGAAGGHRIAVYPGRIEILAETKRICGLLGLDPLGLIGSGSLLVVCEAAVQERLAADLRATGTAVSRIGEVLEAGEGVEARNEQGETVPWPHFDVDELARLFQKLRQSEGNRS